MNSEDQAKGEKLVRDVLINPLLELGLGKPSTLTKDAFEEMTKGLCARLAYMSEAHLAALQDQIAANPAGKGNDRFPIAATILKWAAQIQPPSDDASPLIRAVFSSGMGRDAVANGWAPELLDHLRQYRRWPVPYAVTKIQENAEESVRRLKLLNEADANGHRIPERDQIWANRRHAKIEKCRTISEMEVG